MISGTVSFFLWSAPPILLSNSPYGIRETLSSLLDRTRFLPPIFFPFPSLHITAPVVQNNGNCSWFLCLGMRPQFCVVVLFRWSVPFSKGFLDLPACGTWVCSNVWLSSPKKQRFLVIPALSYVQVTYVSLLWQGG